jgi:hypothetical protein
MLRDNENMINDFDVERLLGDLPIDLIKENIKTQIEDPLVFVTNHCDQVYETFNESMNELGHIENYKTQLDEIRDDFNVFLLLELDRRFDLGVDLENLQSFEAEEVAKCCYDLFVVNLRETITRFITNYILINKSSLSELFNDEYKRKDVTTTNMKRLTKNREDILVLSNIISVIYHVLDLEHDPDDFMELAIEPGEYSGETVKEYVHSFKIANNFVYTLMNEVKYIHNDIIDEIASEISIGMQGQLISEEPSSGFSDFE